MELVEFLRQTQEEVRERVSDGLLAGDDSLSAEMVFTEIVMGHMADIGMTYEPRVCHYDSRMSNSTLRLSGYAASDDGMQVDLFVSLYEGTNEVSGIPDGDTRQAAEQCLRFLVRCAEGRLAGTVDEASDLYILATTLQECYRSLEHINIYVLTDRVAKSKNFKAREVDSRTVRLEVMDIERLHRHWAAGKPRDELIVDFADVAGGPIPCVYVKGELIEYDYALTAIPGDVLRFLYEKFGARLLEANVRSFLGSTGKVNPGIYKTLRQSPERFMAFNNGIVIVTDEIRLGMTAEGGPGISWLKGMQIVNGGQTTASIYFAKKKFDVDLGNVRVPAKIVVLYPSADATEDALIADISRYANTQNSVKQSDLSANRPYHVAMEKLSTSVYCPDGVGRWFYERAAGSYQVLLAREGTTPARLRQLKEAIPVHRRVTKTDLAKYLNAWDQKPDAVSRGSQKNFELFMTSASGGEMPLERLDAAEFRRMIARGIIYKRAEKMIRKQFPAFQANVTAYTLSLLSNRLGARLDLDRIWNNQDISGALQAQISTWADEVNSILHRSAGGRMVSEWAKKPECWEGVVAAPYSTPSEMIPELR